MQHLAQSLNALHRIDLAQYAGQLGDEFGPRGILRVDPCDVTLREHSVLLGEITRDRVEVSLGIADRIEQVTRGAFVVGPGSLFPALHRLAEKGWIDGEWGELETGHRAKFYSITRLGRAHLAEERRNWERILTAMNQVLAEEV